MVDRGSIVNDYFDWLYDKVCGCRFGPDISFRKLLMHLHNTEFRFSIPNDCNRASNGRSMRWRFSLDRSEHLRDVITESLNDPCSVLEMMVALAIHCEENIMDNPRYGDRTGQWFWCMISNLGLSGQTDDHFDKDYVTYVLNRFLDRKYDHDGKGGLFYIRGSTEDMRRLEISHQLNRYLEKFP